MISRWPVDRTAGWLGAAFLITLLGSEAALSLPDEQAAAATVATFYTDHRSVIIVLQVVGFVSCALLALFALRLHQIDRGVAVAGVILAVAALAPGLITVALAIAADPQNPSTADTLNRLEPRGDDLLFIGIALFAVVVAVRLGRSPLWVGIVAAVVALTCVLRLALEVLGRPRGFLDSLAPITFLVLVAALVWLRFRGYPRSSTVEARS
jgi:FtsH-binding integral membrane protein